MDIFLGKVTQQAMNYAIRSGITLTATYAIKQSARLLKVVESSERAELQDLQERLDNKIRIISPAIDMIELISARGNTSLESAVNLTKTLRRDIQNLGQRLSIAANSEESLQKESKRQQDRLKHAQQLKSIAQAIRKLLSRIEDAVPLINLAITASGASLSSSLPATISPSRLLQASTLLTIGDSQYHDALHPCTQIGPDFVLSLYMLFQGHLRHSIEEDVSNTTWKEVLHKAVVRLMRVPLDSLHELPDESTTPKHPLRADEYAYQLLLIEDLEDDRVHTFEEYEAKPGPFNQVKQAGIREFVPIHQLSKIFYADTGKILNIGASGEANAPVLLLKRDLNAVAPRKSSDRYDDDYDDDVPTSEEGIINPASLERLGANDTHNASDDRESTEAAKLDGSFFRFPPGLDPEWMALEVYTEASDSEDETEDEISVTTPDHPTRSSSEEPALSPAVSRLRLDKPVNLRLSSADAASPCTNTSTSAFLPPTKTSLSLLEMLLRLVSLQQFQQSPHLSIPDELLSFFLSESASTGTASHDVEERKRLREDARRHVGFDPYDESPIKRRGEDYQYMSGSRHEADEWNDDVMNDRHRAPPSSFETPASTPSERRRSTPSRSSAPQSLRRPQLDRIRPASEINTREKGRPTMGSPLARSSDGLTDEGIGSSPSSGAIEGQGRSSL